MLNTYSQASGPGMPPFIDNSGSYRANGELGTNCARGSAYRANVQILEVRVLAQLLGDPVRAGNQRRDVTAPRGQESRRMSDDVERAHPGQRLSIGNPRPRLGLAAFSAYACDFLEAAKNTRSSGKYFRPAQLYLACHALDLALKAYLWLQGRPVDNRETGVSRDDLVSLLAQADLCGLTDIARPSPPQRAQIKKAAVYYSAMVLEYPALAEALRGYPRCPDVESFLAVATVLVSAIRQQIDELGQRVSGGHSPKMRP